MHYREEAEGRLTPLNGFFTAMQPLLSKNAAAVFQLLGLVFWFFFSEWQQQVVGVRGNLGRQNVNTQVGNWLGS